MTDSDSLTVYLTMTAAPSSPRVPIVVTKTATPSQLRAQAAEATKIPPASIRLIFRGRLIAEDDSKQVIEEYKLEDESVLHCMGKPSTTAPETAAAPMATTTTAGSSVSVLPTVPAAAAPPSLVVDPLQAALTQLRSSNSSSVYLTAVTTLEKILTNIADHPMEEKYRKVKRQNAAFQRRLGGLSGGHAAMLAAGFVVDEEDSYVVQASPDAWPKLMATKVAVEAAVREAKVAAGGGAPPAPAASGFGASMPGAGMPGMGMPGMGGGMPGMGAGMPNMTPEMERAMSSMMSDPNAIQSMLQVRVFHGIVLLSTLPCFSFMFPFCTFQEPKSAEHASE